MKRWEDLLLVILTNNTHWMAIGDLNDLLCSSEKKWGHSGGKVCPLFNDFLEVSNLQDLGFKGPPFTWYHGGLSERLDKAIENDCWLRTFLSCSVTHLSRIKSDHKPLFLSLNPSVILPKVRPFRFLAEWVEHFNFSDFVKEKWCFKGNMANSLNLFTDNIKAWNNFVYGIIGVPKRYLMQRLSNVQKALDRSYTVNLSFVETQLRKGLEYVLHHEELLWKQKARFFQNLYGEVPVCTRPLLASSFSKINCDDEIFLRRVVSDEEIKMAMFDMAPLKALRSDDFHVQVLRAKYDVKDGLYLSINNILKQRLLTQTERLRHGVSSDTMCSIRGQGIEYVLYTIKDCDAAKKIWYRIIPPNKLTAFFSSNLQEWLKSNLESHLNIDWGNVDWPYFFGLAA
ncbi:hypothetical protein J1N35_034606 [Gossypium stocksii]|uniref:Uncharacterized protein n=1 Tax=Gossypium stocksii TaxID=47602 RepID=A0A9D3ZPE0_9ROSI|nr:hypothetical protein J1N35_034606 [Gossypium stocksii]